MYHLDLAENPGHWERVLRSGARSWQVRLSSGVEAPHFKTTGARNLATLAQSPTKKVKTAGFMDWIVFGDDWGAHPSTTQHLISNLPAEDRVIWVNSIGGRAPGLNRRDVLRVYEKLKSMLRARGPTPDMNDPRQRRWQPNRVISPRVLPWHHVGPIRALNQRLLGKQIRDAMDDMGFGLPVILTSTPVAGWYFAFPHGRTAYLRLDDYEKLPGVDANLVRSSEGKLYDSCDFIFVTAETLFPTDEAVRAKTHYIPQGVDAAHFGSVPPTPPQNKVLGFFGLLAEWIDFDLIQTVATDLPDWQLEFVGPIRYVPDSIRSLRNVSLLPPEPYASLPQRLHSWDAAWIPFNVDELTAAVNPLKLREYLAAGLPTVCTALPEAARLGKHVKIVHTGQDVISFLRGEVASDTTEKRDTRKHSVSDHTWQNRSRQLRTTITSGGAPVRSASTLHPNTGLRSE